jgi:hypothetical protein
MNTKDAAMVEMRTKDLPTLSSHVAHGPGGDDWRSN